MTRPSLLQFVVLLIIVSITVPGLAQSKTPKTTKGRAIEIPGKRVEGRSGSDRSRSNADSQPRDRSSDRGSSGSGLFDAIRGDRDRNNRDRSDRDSRSGSSARPQSGRDSDRRDSQRSRLGISIGPGGLQIYRGPSGSRLGIGSRSQPHFGRDPWGRSSGRTWPGYYGNGWGITIQPRQQVQEFQQPVIVQQATNEPENLPVPTAAETAGMPEVEVRSLLLFAVDRFNDELGGISTGAGWRDYLRVEDLKRLIPPPETAPPAPGTDVPVNSLITESTHDELAKILKRFDQTAENLEYRQINGMWGFQTAHVTLRELLIPPVQRLHKQLGLSAELLEDDLKRFETGLSWISHLKLSELKRIATIRPAELSPKDRTQMQELLLTFDRTAADPNYSTISDLPGFRMAVHVMRAYLPQLSKPAPAPVK
jgi:hypothetical protein